MTAPATEWNELQRSAARVGRRLQELGDHQLVLAESCTAGLIAAALATVPGISRYLLGSAVVYRPEAKTGWLGIDAEFLERFSSESKQASLALANNTLERSPTATVALAITGHLGPNAPAGKDGTIWIAVAQRTSAVSAGAGDGPTRDGAQFQDGGRVQACAFAPRHLKSTLRDERLCEAADIALRILAEYLQAIND